MELHALVLLLDGPSRPSARHAQGWLYRQLRAAHPELHDPSGPKPFTVGVGGAAAPWLRFTFLDGTLFAALEPALGALPGQTLRLGAAEYPVREVLRNGHPWAGESSYADLLAAPHLADAPLEFASPTFFRRQGSNYPLPEPKLVFGSLAERWNAFSPIPLPDDTFLSLTERLTLRHYRLQSRSAAAISRTVGCLGRATYHLPRATPEEARWLTALAHSAFYAGVGAKTTLGFGRTTPYDLTAKPTP